MNTDFHAQRKAMVSRQLAARGIKDPQVLGVMGEVPREHFVPDEYQARAYDDGPLPILVGQTISQPYIVALMIEALQLKGHHRVLDIGTGSGYAAAVIGRIAAEVYSVERIAELLEYARPRFQQLGYSNIYTHLGDGTLGWPEQAPFDAILVSAAGPAVPQSLRQQLAVDGNLVMPVGEERGIQTLVRETRITSNKFDRKELCEVRFVPLLGAQGFIGCSF